MARILKGQLGTVDNVPYYGSALAGAFTRNPVDSANCIISGFDITLSKSGETSMRCYNGAIYYNAQDRTYYMFFPMPNSNQYLGVYKIRSTILSESRVQNTAWFDEEIQDNIYMESNFITVYNETHRFPYFNYSLNTQSLGGTFNWDSDIPIFNDLGDFISYVCTPIIEYQWSSVPAISGKMGILSLTEILNINDGEPVNNVAASGNVDFSRKTKINNLVKNAMDIDDDPKKATVKYNIPKSDYEYTKLVYKKKKIPKSISDGTAIDISENDTEAYVTNLDEDSTYYFIVITNKTKSKEYKYKTGEEPVDEGYSFAYTGAIQTFTAPKTGIYQLETWGAQGGNAVDGNLTARGGYGAYAKGEVFLAQGDTLYINVGGQNGYGGGGGLVPYCLRQIMYEGSLVDLLQINDLSIIPNSLINSTSFHDVNIESYTTAPSNPPEYVESLGDAIWIANTETTSEDTEHTFIESTYLKVSFGKHLISGFTYWGLLVYDKVSGTDFRYGFSGSNVPIPSGKERTFRLGVIIDHENKRAYLMVYMLGYVPNRGNNTFYFDMYGGKVNGTDYVYETFKNY